MTPEAQRYLADRLQHVRRVRADQSGFEALQSIIAHIGGALEAFRLTGAISDDEFSDWMGRSSCHS